MNFDAAAMDSAAGAAMEYSDAGAAMYSARLRVMETAASATMKTGTAMESARPRAMEIAAVAATTDIQVKLTLARCHAFQGSPLLPRELTGIQLDPCVQELTCF
jgi:hypothetical protein